MDLTDEQQRIVSTDVDTLRVRAFAGTGKTTTLAEFARQRTNERILYVAFNGSVQEEAEKTFPDNTEARTINSLAYGGKQDNYQDGVGYKYADQLYHGSLPLKLIKDHRPIGTFDYAATIRQTLQNFMVSMDRKLQPRHVPNQDGLLPGKVIEQAKALWDDMVDPKDDSVPMVHDGYMKLFHLTNPDLSDRYDRILFDEAQDQNPVNHAIVQAQPLPTVYVGDAHQSIYQFRGAINALDQIDADETLRLTTSFRFGDDIANLANRVLANYKDGFLQDPAIIRGFQDEDRVGSIDSSNHYAHLHRTFAECFGTAVELMKADQRMHWVGGIDGYDLDELEDLYRMKQHQYGRVQNRHLLGQYDGFDEFKEIAEQTEDPEMLRSVHIVNQYDSDIPGFREDIEELSVSDPTEADVSLATAHRAKGKEWDQVRLADDFDDLEEEKGSMDRSERIQEANLQYVAVTRAKKRIDPLDCHEDLSLPEALKTTTDAKPAGS